jgi:hypothetical protein
VTLGKTYENICNKTANIKGQAMRKKMKQSDTLYICNDHRITERGNVVWFILLAIALTAALTITLSRSADKGGQTGDTERNRVQASEILRYATGLERAIDNLALQGVSESLISFENDSVAGYANANCPDKKSNCALFYTGGGSNYMTPRKEWLDTAYKSHALFGQWFITGHTCVEDVGLGDATCNNDGNDNEDLVIFLPFVTEDLCRQINTLLNISGDPPVETGTAWDENNTKFTGSFGEGQILNQSGRRSGCFQAGNGDEPPTGSYTFYHVLLER